MRFRELIDFRLYRIAFLPALIAVIVVMFSLEGAPKGLEPGTLRGDFDGERAATLARQIANTAPDRTPGSEGDSRIADLVADSFGEVSTGAVSEQRYEASYDGDDVSLRNVVLTLPGDSNSTVVIAAARDAARSPAAASSAAATAILLELANTFRISHERTYVLASISGSKAGSAGIKDLIDKLGDPAAIDAVIVISQPGSAEREPPFVITSSTGEASGSVQLERTAELAVTQQAGEHPAEASVASQLARLAFPSGLGDQAPLIAAGVDAVAISSAGERPLDSGADQLDDLSPKSIDEFGRAVQATVGALDFSTSEPIHGPRTHLRVGENMIPGWALAALALALLLPAAVAAVDACARAGRRRLELAGGLAWAAARSLPFIGALAVLYGLALVGLVPRPPFPFDPGLYGLGARGAVAFAAILLVGGASAVLLRLRRITAEQAPPSSLAACGVLAVAACLAIWLANPYLALLLAATAHVWLLALRPGRARAVLAGMLAVAACVPVLVAVAVIANALDLGLSTPWTFAIMVGDGQIGLAVALSSCLLGGALVGAVALASRTPAEAPVDA